MMKVHTEVDLVGIEFEPDTDEVAFTLISGDGIEKTVKAKLPDKIKNELLEVAVRATYPTAEVVPLMRKDIWAQRSFSLDRMKDMLSKPTTVSYGFCCVERINNKLLYHSAYDYTEQSISPLLTSVELLKDRVKDEWE